MKKFTLFKSALALIAAFVMVLPTSAQVASVADLFGTYKFTATVNITDAGKDLADNFKSECDVTITKCSYGVFDGEIQGLAGATAAQSINSIDLAANTIKITNPNGNGLWGGGLYMSNTEGVYPFGVYNDILYTFDPATKTITLPDFTLVTCNHKEGTATVVATFTNAKLTLVSSESIDIADLSGDWHFAAGKGTYDVMEGSTLPTEFDMTLTATDDTKKNYSISMKLGDFAPLALTATFDGVTMTIPFDETYFDAENKIGLVNMYGQARPGTITFNLINESTLSLTSGMTIAQDSISPEVKGGYMQWYVSGTAKKQDAEAETVTWAGTYKVKVANPYVNLADYTVPTEFDMEVTYFEDWGIYLVTKFLGEDVSSLNNGGINFYPSEDDPNKAEIKTGGYLRTITAGEHYLALKDMNMSDSNSSLVMTRLEDGSYTISDFCVSSMTYDENWAQKHELATFCQTVTATKEEVKEEPQAFSWTGTFTVKAGSIDTYNANYTYPEQFEMEVTYNENWGMYIVTKFFGNDVAGLNQGGIVLTPNADDPKTATLNTGALLGTIEAGKLYYMMYDMNATNSPLTLTANEDGSFSIANFCVSIYNWETNAAEAAALYKDVVATPGSTVEPEPQPEPYNWANTFAVKAESISVYNDAYTYPKEFDMEVTYSEYTGGYFVTKFFGQDVVGLNYGGIQLTPSKENPNKAELKTDSYLQMIEGGKTYLKMYDMNATSSPIELTVNEDGSISISSFCVSLVNFETNATEPVALYNGVTATVGTTQTPDDGNTDSNIIYSWEGAEGSAIEKGGTAVCVGDTEGRVNYSNKWGDVTYWTISINKKKDVIDTDNITINLEQALEATDQIAITAYRNKDTDANGTLYMKFENGTVIDEGNDVVWNNVALDQQPNTNTYSVGEGAGSKAISITRSKAGTNVFITKFVITRGGTDGISSVETVVPAKNAIFNLSGQRVSKTFKGIVIMNGKKYLVK